VSWESSLRHEVEAEFSLLSGVWTYSRVQGGYQMINPERRRLNMLRVRGAWLSEQRGVCRCGVTFTFRRARQKFCSNRCKQADKYARKRAEGKNMAAKQERYGLQYETKLQACAKCGTLRPLPALTDGRCNDWDRCKQGEVTAP
jgi:hypothetical protein